MSIPPTLTKLSCLLLSLVCCYISGTAPAESASSAEREAYGRSVIEDVFVRINIPRVVKMITVCATLADIVSILVRQWHASGQASTSACTPTFVLGITLLVIGTSLRMAAYRELGHQFTSVLALRKGHRLITSGVYSIVRHPSYTGYILFSSGFVVCQFCRGSFWAEELGRSRVVGCVYGGMAVFAVGCGVWRTGREDEVLRREFKEVWEVWAGETRYRLVPYVF